MVPLKKVRYSVEFPEVNKKHKEPIGKNYFSVRIPWNSCFGNNKSLNISKVVLRIRDVYPGSWFSTQKPGLWIRINFLRIRIRIQSLMLETNTDPDPNPGPDPDPNPIRIQGLNDQKLKKITTENFFFFFDQKLQFTYP